MSERQIRILLAEIHEHFFAARYDVQVKEALAADPDIVVVLRELAKGIELCRRPLKSAIPFGVHGQRYWENQARCYERVKSWIEREFAVRLLPDGGWEWTNTQTDNP